MKPQGFTHEQHGGAVEWYTPPFVFGALGLTFDLDPCAPDPPPHWIPAKRFYHPADDGLLQPWFGRVWLNPPYDERAQVWLEKLAGHGNGIALVFARTDTRWFHFLVPTATGICFVKGRIAFVNQHAIAIGSGCGSPSMLIAFGDENWQALRRSTLGLCCSVTDPVAARRCSQEVLPFRTGT